jgi:hypothetical protein
MASRLELQILLEDILGSHNVYFQPPASIEMHYPAIVYSRSNIVNEHANDEVYMQNKSYEITVIDEDPDGEIVDRISRLPHCQFDRHFKSDNLNHDVFTLYF